MKYILEIYGDEYTKWFSWIIWAESVTPRTKGKWTAKSIREYFFFFNYKPILYMSHILLNSVRRIIMKKRISHFISTYHFSIFHFLSIKHSLHYEHIIIEKEIGLHFSSASIAAPISACWMLLNKIKVRYTLI